MQSGPGEGKGRAAPVHVGRASVQREEGGKVAQEFAEARSVQQRLVCARKGKKGPGSRAESTGEGACARMEMGRERFRGRGASVAKVTVREGEVSL